MGKKWLSTITFDLKFEYLLFSFCFAFDFRRNKVLSYLYMTVLLHISKLGKLNCQLLIQAWVPYKFYKSATNCGKKCIYNVFTEALNVPMIWQEMQRWINKRFANSGHWRDHFLQLIKTWTQPGLSSDFVDYLDNVEQIHRRNNCSKAVHKQYTQRFL